MATFTTSEQYGANPIIDSSLILYMDAGNPKSYPNYNMLQYTQTFTDASWSKLNCAITTTNNLAPDGTNTASFLKEDSSGSSHLLSSNTVTLVPLGYRTFTASAYMKAGTRNFGAIVLFDGVTGSTANCLFNLSNGVIGVSTTNGSGVLLDHSMQLVDNGYYLCKITALMNVQNSSAGYGVAVYNTNSTSNYVGDNTSGIYVWGAQMTEGRDLKPYKVNTTTRPTLVTNLVGSQNGTLTNGTIVSGGIGGVFNFDGTDDYIGGITQSINIQKNTPFSVSCIFKTTTATAGLIGNWNAFVTPGWRLLLDNGGRLRFYLLNAGGDSGVAVQSTTVYNDNKYYHVTATYDGSTSSAGMKIYINGIDISAPSILNSNPGTLVNVGIIIGTMQANNTAYNAYINGQIALPMIYNRVLTSAEVWQNYKATKDRFIK